MRKKGPKEIFFVCCSIVENNLVSDTIEAKNSIEAVQFFRNKYLVSPKYTQGPFYKKRDSISKVDIKFSGKSKKCTYDGWIVKAFMLKEPENYAYLIFDQRIDNTVQSKPKENYIINIEELKDL